MIVATALFTLATLSATAGIVVNATPADSRGPLVAELPYQFYFLSGDDYERTLHCWFPNTEVEVVVTEGETQQPLIIGYEPMLGDYVTGFKDPDADATVVITRSGGQEFHVVSAYRIDSMNNATLLACVEGLSPDNPYVEDYMDTVDIVVIEIADGIPAYLEVRGTDHKIQSIDFNGRPFE